jgi:hypothetical protein
VYIPAYTKIAFFNGGNLGYFETGNDEGCFWNTNEDGDPAPFKFDEIRLTYTGQDSYY